MKHTPGDWKVTHSLAPDWTGDWYIHAPGGKLIVMSEGWSDEEQANARLIAAAPNLLEALEDISNKGISGRGLGNVLDEMRTIAREAIHKTDE